MGLLAGEEEFSEVSLDELALEAAFFGGAFGEFAAVAVAVEVDGVGVHEAGGFAEAEGDFEGVGGGVSGEAADSVAAVAGLEVVVVGGFLEGDGGNDDSCGRSFFSG